MRKSREIWDKWGFGLLLMSLSIAMLTTFANIGFASQSETIHHYKILSALEYSGKSQFINEFETVCIVKKLVSLNDKVQYFLSTNKPDVAGNDLSSTIQSPLNEMSFIVDAKTQHLSTTGKELAFLEKISNECAKALSKVTKANLGKTWKQGFILSSFDNSLPNEVGLTLTAMPLKTENFGELIAVRALSEPFIIKTAKEDGSVGYVQCRVNSVYVFDQEIEDVYLSISVFTAATNTNGFNEVLQHSIATCKADANGQPIDVSDFGNDKDFENFVSKIGVTKKLNVVNVAPLPQWARADGIKAAQMANICAATSCEGTLNPVATCLPIARIVELQSSNSSEPITTGAMLAASEGEGGGTGTDGQGGGWFDWFGWNWKTGAVVGGTLGTIAIAGGFSGGGGGGHRTPSTP